MNEQTALILAALIAAGAPTAAVVVTAMKANGKLNHITILTNSTLSAAMDRIAELEDRVEHLQGIRAGHDEP